MTRLIRIQNALYTCQSALCCTPVLLACYIAWYRADMNPLVVLSGGITIVLLLLGHIALSALLKSEKRYTTLKSSVEYSAALERQMQEQLQQDERQELEIARDLQVVIKKAGQKAPASNNETVSQKP